MKQEHIVALFDLDGVVFNTEPQYSSFWHKVGKAYYPEIEGFENIIKGQTLVQIFERWFPDKEEIQRKLVEDLNDFEQNMDYLYVPGVLDFLRELRHIGVQTAVVTSSNAEKMKNVYQVHPDFKTYFDRIFTSEYFKYSKPDPDCYLLGAKTFGVKPDACVVFEDSFNGLKAGRAAGMKVVGLSTTNSYEDISDLCDEVIPDFTLFTVEKMMKLFH